MTSQSNRNLRPFQQRVFDVLSGGRCVILQAPTGAGKTRAALYPYLHWFAESLRNTQLVSPLPTSCRYAVPLRVLASQFFREYEHSGAKIDKLLATRLHDIYAQFGQRVVQVQTGEKPDDPLFESALTFCTIDQLLASFLGVPYGLGMRRANLNVGAVIGSYLVLDEFHLYPLARDGAVWGARTTTLQMLELLHHRKQRLTPFVLMTATFSSRLLERLAELLSAEVVRVEAQDELVAISSGRERRFTVHNEPMEAGIIIDIHVDCSLVVCNTVLRAQRMYLELQKELHARKLPIRPLLIHSRFTDKNRHDQQAEIERLVGKQAWSGDQHLCEEVIIVATQVVEVGLDISVRNLHSEAAPANSIVQRAGRCARFANQQGIVHLYPLDEGESDLPYASEPSATTLEAFRSFGNVPIGFLEEQAVIDAVHTEEDRTLLDRYEQERPRIRKRIFGSLTYHDRSVVPHLIRDVQQATLLIHDDPNNTITERPWEWQTFSLHPGSLVARWDQLDNAAQENREFADDRPIVWEAQFDERDLGNEENERRQVRYRWDPVATSARASLALMLVLSPEIATYSEELGLVLRDGRLDFPWPVKPFRSRHEPQYRRNTHRGGFYYNQESYAEHVGGLLKAFLYSRLREDVRFIGAALEQACGFRSGVIEDAIRVAIACHDIGKLGEGWQGWATAWQELLAHEHGEEYRQRKMPLAHTDYEPGRDRVLERQVKSRRPPHACESAWLSALFVADVLGGDDLYKNPLARAVVASIARHHGATAQQAQPIRLIADARQSIHEVIDLLGQGRNWNCDLTLLDTELTETTTLDDPDVLTIPSDDVSREIETWLYFVIVRVLRLADRRSFRY
jgi:CRISPR-associated endonuclease/helicase Cas3